MPALPAHSPYLTVWPGCMVTQSPPVTERGPANPLASALSLCSESMVCLPLPASPPDSAFLIVRRLSAALLATCPQPL